MAETTNPGALRPPGCELLPRCYPNGHEPPGEPVHVDSHPAGHNLQGDPDQHGTRRSSPSPSVETRGTRSKTRSPMRTLAASPRSSSSMSAGTSGPETTLPSTGFRSETSWPRSERATCCSLRIPVQWTRMISSSPSWSSACLPPAARVFSSATLPRQHPSSL